MLKGLFHPITFRFGLVAALCAISYLAFTPQHHEIAEKASDKINHLIAFATLAWLIDGAFQPWQSKWLLKILALLGYGALIELVQLGLPHRSFSLLDLAADAAGIGLYAIPALIIVRMTTNRRNGNSC